MRAQSSPGVVLAAATAAQAAVALINFGLPAIGPALRSEFELSLPELGAVLTAGLLGSGLALVAAGVAVDRFGSRLSMLAGAALATGGLLAASRAGSKETLVAAMLIFGVGSAVIPIAGTSELFRAYPASRRGWALGVRQTAVPLGGVVAAIALPLIEAAGGVQAALVVSAVLVGVTGAVFALVAGPARQVHARTRQQDAFRRIMRAPGMLRLLAVAAIYIVALQALVSYAVPSARAAGFSGLVAGASFVAVNLAAVVARIAWGRIADRDGGTRRVRTLVEVGLVAAAGAVFFTLSLHVGWVAVVPAAAVFAVGALGWNALVYVSAGERASPELAARSVAVAATVVFVVSALCTPPLGALAAHAGWDALWLSTGLLALAGAAVASRLPAGERA